MLAKLLKYEIPTMGRRLGPLLLAWLVASVLLGVSLNVFNDGFLQVLAPLIYGMVTTAVFVMYVILIIQRYNSSLLGDEAYFNLTLPVSMNEHIANKAISALVWTVITGLAALASVLIIAFVSGGLGFAWRQFMEGFKGIPAAAYLALLEVLVVGIFSIVKSILAIYAAITIGHQASQRTTLASIGAYIVLMIIESSIGSLFVSLGLKAEANMYINEAFNDLEGFHLIMLVSLITTLAFSAAYFFICKQLMEKRLNLA